MVTTEVQTCIDTSNLHDSVTHVWSKAIVNDSFV